MCDWTLLGLRVVVYDVQPPPLSPYQSGHSVSYLASLIDHDSLQPDIHTLYIFEQFILYIYTAFYNCTT